MTTPEVQAAERLRRSFYDPQCEVAYTDDERAVLNWALPLLDTTAIDEAWMRAVLPKDTQIHITETLISFALGGWHVTSAGSGPRIAVTCERKQLTTRGQLRQLALGLGLALERGEG